MPEGVVRIRRSSNIFVLFCDRASVDLDAFFSGTVSVHSRTQVLGISLITGKTAELSPPVLTMFAAVDSVNWRPQDAVVGEFDISAAHIEQLIEDGFMLTDGNEARAARLRELDARLDRHNWNPHQALAYVMSRWDNQRIEQAEGRSAAVLTDYEKNVRAFGRPPGHFHQVESLSRTPLCEASADGQLFTTLGERYTARGFRTDAPMAAIDLSRLLYYTFGAQAEIPLADGFSVLKKTSPSGGALHPIEAYPLVLNVQGIESGIYHYNVRHHALDLMQGMSVDQAREAALRSTCGQDYFASADFIVLMTGRYDRCFWKYRNHAKARRVVDLDAGHLSQTFYLLATTLGYGPFMTAAISDGYIEALLGLAYLKEGAIAAVGCGSAAEGQDRLAN